MKSPVYLIYLPTGIALAILAVVLVLFYRSAPANRPEEMAAATASHALPAEPPESLEDEESADRLAPENQKEIVLFFQSENSDRLYPELRSIVRTASVLTQAKQVMVELIAGSREGHLPVISEEARLREIYTCSDGTVCVDFTRHLVENHSGGSAGEIATVYAIVNSLTVNFPEIKRVRILVEGEERETLKDHIDLSLTFSQDLSLVEEWFL